MQNIFIATGGGFGDFLKDYFRDNKHWGYLKGIKTLYPRANLKVMACTHNTVLEEFFQHHPYVNQFENYGWRVNGWEVFDKYSAGYTYIEKVNLNNIIWEKPTLHLTPEDEAQVNAICHNKKIMVIHPFSIRRSMPLDEFIYLTDKLIDELGYTVVVIGGTHVRLANLNCINKADGGIEIKEEFPYERNGLVNLVNKSNIRVTLKVLQNANGFVGHGSCFNMMAWLHNIKSVVYSRAEERDLILRNHMYGWPVIQKLPWCKNYFSDEWTDAKQIINETVDFFRNP